MRRRGLRRIVRSPLAEVERGNLEACRLLLSYVVGPPIKDDPHPDELDDDGNLRPAKAGSGILGGLFSPELARLQAYHEAQCAELARDMAERAARGECEDILGAEHEAEMRRQEAGVRSQQSPQ